MSFLLSHILQVIAAYQPPDPLHLFLKHYFAQHKQLGSRDRKAISEGVYIYFRWGRFYPELEVLQVIRLGIAQGQTSHAFLVRHFEDIPLPESLSPAFPAGFPGLSEGISEEDYFGSLLQQPLLFIRPMNGGLTPEMLDRLEIQSIHSLPSSGQMVYGLVNGTPVQNILEESAYIVQDYSSQRVLDLAKSRLHPGFHPEHIWDVCSGAGGKSIMAKLLWPDSKILATDIRGGILKNLKNRFKLYQLGKIRTEVLDVSQARPSPAGEPDRPPDLYDLIICDVPCSGSGTWSRTPEHFFYFRYESLDMHQERQMSIANNALQFLKRGGYMIYITCSVFHMENEAVLHYLLEKNEAELVCHEFINGTADHADSMYFAVIQRR